jgi:hypothetical protein
MFLYRFTEVHGLFGRRVTSRQQYVAHDDERQPVLVQRLSEAFDVVLFLLFGQVLFFQLVVIIGGNDDDRLWDVEFIENFFIHDRGFAVDRNNLRFETIWCDMFLVMFDDVETNPADALRRTYNGLLFRISS